MLDLTFFDIPIQKNIIDIFKEYEQGINMVPLKTIFSYLKTGDINVIIVQLLGNFLLLLPMGIYISLMVKKINLKRIIILSILLGSSIEIIQALLGLFIGVRYRSIDIDDIILNAFGFFIGYLFHLIIKPWYTKMTK